MADKYTGKHRSGVVKNGPNGFYEGKHTAAYFERIESAEETALFFAEVGFASAEGIAKG